MPRNLRGWASCGLLLAVLGCSEAPPNVAGTDPGATATPVPQVNSNTLALSPDTIVLNAPYSYTGFDHTGISNNQALANPVAGYVTRALLSGRFGDREATGSELVWSSSNPEIVTVTGDGLVESLDTGTYGTVIITARSKANPSLVATASILLRNDGKLALELI